jgi:hypothetical protein
MNKCVAFQLLRFIGDENSKYWTAWFPVYRGNKKNWNSLFRKNCMYFVNANLSQKKNLFSWLRAFSEVEISFHIYRAKGVLRSSINTSLERELGSTLVTRELEFLYSGMCTGTRLNSRNCLLPTETACHCLLIHCTYSRLTSQAVQLMESWTVLVIRLSAVNMV